MSWHLKEQLKQTLNREQGASIYAPGSRTGFALVYPNTYHVGMSNLGFHIIYQQINSRKDTACERLFLPEKKAEEEYIRTNTPFLTLETQRPLYEFPLIGVAMTFEMDYFNLVKILDLGRVPVLASDRGEQDSFVIMGGPCATFNPEPLAPFLDACVIGEGEEVIHNLLDVYYQAKSAGLSRVELLRKWAQIPGIYVPQFYQPLYDDTGMIAGIDVEDDIPPHIDRRWIADLDRYDAQTIIVTEDTEFRNMFLVEVARGCGRHCRFCMAGYCYRRPRTRTLEKLKNTIAKVRHLNLRIGLMGAAISDYPEIDELCNYIKDEGLSMSVASLRADSLTGSLVEALAASGHKTITLAPEAASKKMRQVINKGITDEHLFTSIDMAVKAGIPNVRLYIMVGLPFEEESDIAEISEMATRVKKHMDACGSKGKLTLSINPFIPKPFTPFQWLPMADMNLVEERLKTVKDTLKALKNIEVLIESPKEAYIQGTLARGDRRLASVLLTSHRNGGVKGWRKALKEHNISEAFYLYRERKQDEILPWNVLEMGLDKGYLFKELINSRCEKYTPPCVAGCKRCGVCK